MKSLEQVLARIDALEADPEEDEGWRGLSDELKDAVQRYSLEGSDDEDGYFSLNGYDTRKLWNILSSSKKALIKKLPSDIIGVYLGKAFVQRIQLDCKDIKLLFDEHVTVSTKAGKDSRAMDLLRFYGTFYPKEKTRAPRPSEAANDDSSDASAASFLGDSVVADRIHYKMFTDQHELFFQKFKRFEIGGRRDPTASLENLIKSLGLGGLQSNLMEFLPEALHNFKCARSFLSHCVSPSEALTQTVFWLFLAHLTEKMNQCLGSTANVVIVAGMDPIDLKVKVSEKYLALLANKRNETYTGGPKGTVITIKSDLAIIEGSSEKHKSLPVGKQQRKLFIESKVNIEMKRCRRLGNSQNKSQLTQVAAESMMRYVALKQSNKDIKVLYSILTDCMVLYAVCHDVSSKEYWISQSVSTPEEILLSICWLYLCSVGQVEPKVSEWKSMDEEKVRDDEQMEAGGSSTRLVSVDDIDEVNKNSRKVYDHSSHGGASEEYEMLPMVLTFEEDDEEEEREHWQTMFLMENHRKYGTPLPLTEAILSLHDTREGKQTTTALSNNLSFHFARSSSYP